MNVISTNYQQTTPSRCKDIEFSTPLDEAMFLFVVVVWRKGVSYFKITLRACDYLKVVLHTS